MAWFGFCLSISIDVFSFALLANARGSILIRHRIFRTDDVFTVGSENLLGRVDSKFAATLNKGFGRLLWCVELLLPRGGDFVPAPLLSSAASFLAGVAAIKAEARKPVMTIAAAIMKNFDEVIFFKCWFHSCFPPSIVLLSPASAAASTSTATTSATATSAAAASTTTASATAASTAIPAAAVTAAAHAVTTASAAGARIISTAAAKSAATISRLGLDDAVRLPTLFPLAGRVDGLAPAPPPPGRLAVPAPPPPGRFPAPGRFPPDGSVDGRLPPAIRSTAGSRTISRAGTAVATIAPSNLSLVRRLP